MKKIFLLVACIICFSVNMAASPVYQDQNQNEHVLMSEHHYRWMVKNLNLTNAQKQQIQALNQTTRAQIKAKMAQEKTDMSSILTDVQKKQIEQNKQDKKDGKDVTLFDNVKLTKDQKMKTGTIWKKYKLDYKAMKEAYIAKLSTLLTEQQKNKLEQMKEDSEANDME